MRFYNANNVILFLPLLLTVIIHMVTRGSYQTKVNFLFRHFEQMTNALLSTHLCHHCEVKLPKPTSALLCSAKNTGFTLPIHNSLAQRTVMEVLLWM